MYGYSQFQVRGEARLLAPARPHWKMIRGQVCSYQAEHLDDGLFCIYYTSHGPWARAHTSNTCFVSDDQGNNQIFFHLLNVHPKKQHDNVIYNISC